jgi:hypothetical protein
MSKWELGSALLEQDLDGFQRHVQQAFAACRQAVEGELARQQTQSSPAGQHAPSNGATANGNGAAQPNAGNSRSSDPGRQATKSQVRALYAIATRQQFDLSSELRRRFGLYRAEDLSLSQASGLIQEFNQTPTNGSRA